MRKNVVHHQIWGEFPYFRSSHFGWHRCFLNSRGGKYFDMGGWNVGKIILPTLRGLGKWRVRSSDLFTRQLLVVSTWIYTSSGWLILWGPNQRLKFWLSLTNFVFVRDSCKGCETDADMARCHAVPQTAVVCSDFGSLPLFHCFSGVRKSYGCLNLILEITEMGSGIGICILIQLVVANMICPYFHP
jgi:hypothetical protein